MWLATTAATSKLLVFAATALLLCACGSDTSARRTQLGLAEPPPRSGSVCDDGQHEPPSAHACSSDDDCTVCHDGSNCGTVVNLDEYERRGDACRLADAAECEYAVPRCCGGRCVISSH